MIIGLAPMSTVDVQAAEDYRAWAQSDSRWGGLYLGGSASGGTVSGYGCLATSVTKLIIQCGLRNADSYNVGTFVNAMNACGGFTKDGLMYWGKPSSCVSGFTYAGELKSYGSYSSSQYNSQLLTWVKQGYHLILRVNNGGHYIAVDEAKSISTGQIYIMDSFKSGNRADITLTSRYGTFVQVQAYKGGSTPTSGYNPEGVTDVIEGGRGTVHVRGWAFDRDNLSQSITLHVYVGGPAGSGAPGYSIVANKSRPDVNNVYGVGEYHGFDDVIHVSSTGSQQIWIYALNIGAGSANPVVGNATVNIAKDDEKPTLKNIKVTPDLTGYTVECDVSDDAGIDRVQFPTWTPWKDGQDDLVGDWQTSEKCRGKIVNGHVTYRVNRSDHNNELGAYVTDIYVYDKCGNVQAGRTGYSFEETPPVIKDVKVSKDNTGFKVTCKVSDETGVDKVSFFTWTAKNGQDDISKKDIKVDSGEGEEKEITYHVNQSDHNNEDGYYITHIYAYDKLGNRATDNAGILIAINEQI